MSQLEIHFTEGFSGHTAAVSVEGRELLREPKLTTDYRTSLAKIARLEAPAGPSVLTVEIPSENRKATVSIDAAKLKYLTVSRTGSGLKVEPVTIEDYQREPRGYM
jgi:hypothetical protein